MITILQNSNYIYLSKNNNVIPIVVPISIGEIDENELHINNNIAIPIECSNNNRIITIDENFIEDIENSPNENQQNQEINSNRIYKKIFIIKCFVVFIIGLVFLTGHNYFY
jgi:hypothetical protein